MQSNFTEMKIFKKNLVLLRRLALSCAQRIAITYIKANTIIEFVLCFIAEIRWQIDF